MSVNSAIVLSVFSFTISTTLTASPIIALATDDPLPPYENCRFSGRFPTLGVKNTSTFGDFPYAVVQAMNDWNKTATKTKLRAVPSGANIVVDEVSWTNPLDSRSKMYARTKIETDCVNGRWQKTVVVSINRPVMGSISRPQKQIVMAHEYGHALGLGHAKNINGCYDYTMMIQGSLKFYCAWAPPPWSNDIYMLDYIYSGA